MVDQLEILKILPINKENAISVKEIAIIMKEPSIGSFSVPLNKLRIKKLIDYIQKKHSTAKLWYKK
jgi:hypothetical protein